MLLLYHGIKPATSLKKAQLIDRYTRFIRLISKLSMKRMFGSILWIHQAVVEEANVINIDGTHLYKKHQQLACTH